MIMRFQVYDRMETAYHENMRNDIYRVLKKGFSYSARVSPSPMKNGDLARTRYPNDPPEAR
jgi:hypothetical protein